MFNTLSDMLTYLQETCFTLYLVLCLKVTATYPLHYFIYNPNLRTCTHPLQFTASQII